MSVQLAEHLQPIDKACDRWAKERRDVKASLKCTLAAMALKKEGVVLDDPLEMSDHSLLVDRIYLTAPAREKSVLAVWYTETSPVYLKAKKLRMSRSGLYVEWKTVLAYVRGRLHEMGCQM